jgi:hypothetical protein
MAIDRQIALATLLIMLGLIVMHAASVRVRGER